MLVVVLISAAAVINQLIQFRRSESVQRHQIKWFAAAVALFVTTFVFSTLAEVLANLDYTAVIAAAACIPLATGIAILRYRLYYIDIIINRTLVYIPLTAILAGVYIALIGVFKTLLAELMDASSDAAVALTTLIVATLLTPLKNHLQTIVDRYFKEAHDSVRELRKFTEHTYSIVKVLDSEAYVLRFLEKATTVVGAASGIVSLQDSVVPKTLHIRSVERFRRDHPAAEA